MRKLSDPELPVNIGNQQYARQSKFWEPHFFTNGCATAQARVIRRSTTDQPWETVVDKKFTSSSCEVLRRVVDTWYDNELARLLRNDVQAFTQQSFTA